MATQIFAGPLAPGATVSISPTALSVPFRGLQVEIAFECSGMPNEGLYISYAVSIDNGATYSDYQPLTQCAPTTSGTTMESLLLDSTADHIAFQILNNSNVDYTALSISIEEFQ